ncbi:MAG: hypothetical protein ACI4TU_01860, partial [Candidatus Cryptobacteroides sp.]
MMETKKDFTVCKFDIAGNPSELRQFVARIQASADTQKQWEDIKVRIDNNPDQTMSQLREEIQRHLEKSILKDKWQNINEDAERMIPYIWDDQD